ncbi:hypothetical protein ACFX12_005346 [Malus domestica]
MNKESTAEVEVYGGSIGEFFENLWGHMTLNYTNCIRGEEKLYLATETSSLEEVSVVATEVSATQKERGATN